jgi:phosphoglycolate phosphatase-like HAD superfamily hydrolase
MPKFILFDIDGTLIDSGGAGGRALNLAMEELTGIPAGFQGINFAGKTDLQIIREGVRSLGLHSRDGLVESLADRYLARLRAEVSKGRGHVKPGVSELLSKLRGKGDFFLGLLTGNLEKGARIKLGHFGLNPFFRVGAYGSDEEDRNRLLPVAIRRLYEEEGVLVEYKDCIVVGDTPRDVTCAVVHKSRCLAVATGPYSLEALEETKADLVVSDLSDGERILSWMDEG